MARMLGTYERGFCPICKGPDGPDCPAVSRTKKSQRRVEEKGWRRDFEADEFDFWRLRHDAGWFFRGSWSQFWKDRYGAEYNERYAEFGVTPGGWVC